MKRLICILLSVSLIFLCPCFNTYAEEVRIYKRLPQSGDRIALTFDDGPHPRYTERILDLLKKNRIKATFFIIGENVELYGDTLIRRMIDEGHEIGNHTYTHPHTKTAEAESFYEEVRRTHNLMKEKYGYEMKLFRPPEGYVDEKVKAIAVEMNYTIVLWSVDTRDWERAKSDVIVRNVSTNAHAGDIIIMHDFVSKRGYTLPALNEFVPRLLERGLEFVTVSELIGNIPT